MRLVIPLLAVLALVVSAGGTEFGVHGGVLLPTGDAGDAFSTSFMVGGNILVHMPTIAVEGSVSYCFLQPEEDLEGFTASLVPILAGIRSYTGPIFLGGGAGLYISSIEYDLLGSTYSDSDSEFGGYGNVGMIFPTGSFDVEGSVKLHWVDFDDVWISLTAGANF